MNGTINAHGVSQKCRNDLESWGKSAETSMRTLKGFEVRIDSSLSPILRCGIECMKAWGKVPLLHAVWKGWQYMLRRSRERL